MQTKILSSINYKRYFEPIIGQCLWTWFCYIKLILYWMKSEVADWYFHTDVMTNKWRASGNTKLAWANTWQQQTLVKLRAQSTKQYSGSALKVQVSQDLHTDPLSHIFAKNLQKACITVGTLDDTAVHAYILHKMGSKLCCCGRIHYRPKVGFST